MIYTSAALCLWLFIATVQIEPGTKAENPGSIENPIRLPGQYFDSETGLHQNFMRDYDPTLGAYLEQDPYGILTGPNRYGYAYGDPMSFTDPTGEIVFTAPAVAVIVVAGAVYTGFEIYLCGRELWDTCFSKGAIENCLFSAAMAFLPVGALRMVKHVKLLKPVGKIGIPKWLKKRLASDVGAAPNPAKALDDAIKKARSSLGPARRFDFSSRKKAYEAAKKAGKGKKPIHEPHGEHGPHFHPDVPELKPGEATPKKPGRHDHYNYPK
ncbi:RHS repeat-associated core domain-containing protein [Oligoflexia bacterium]|nr:RHS repeat-associated core domain-containing protein [Oligoflexia bacterium]